MGGREWKAEENKKRKDRRGERCKRIGPSWMRLFFQIVGGKLTVALEELGLSLSTVQNLD